MTEKQCSICGDVFSCGADDKGGGCWCVELPPVVEPDPSLNCRCPKCLKSAIAEKIENYVATVTPENAKERGAKSFDTGARLIEGIDYYVEDGLYVFTKWFLLKRGYCCENGCRHCPYGFAAGQASTGA